MWYHMKSKTLEREYDEFQERLQQLRKKNELIPEEHIRLLMRCLQRLKQELNIPEHSRKTRGAAGDVSLFRFDSNQTVLTIFFSAMIVKDWKNRLNFFDNDWVFGKIF